MNQFFNFKRFSLLVLKHWADNKKRYVLSVLAFIGLLIAWFVFGLIMGDHYPVENDVQGGTYFLSLFVTGTFYASQYFRDLGSRARGITFLMVPASTFEKFLCGLLYTVVLFFIVATASFYLVDILMVRIYNSFPPADAPAHKATLVNIFKDIFFQFNNGYAINFLFFFFSIQSAFLFGSVYFRKYSFIKTIIGGFIIWFTVFGTFYLLLGEGGLFGSPWIPQILGILVMYVLAPLFWLLTFYRLKLKQV